MLFRRKGFTNRFLVVLISSGKNFSLKLNEPRAPHPALRFTPKPSCSRPGAEAWAFPQLRLSHTEGFCSPLRVCSFPTGSRQALSSFQTGQMTSDGGRGAEERRGQHTAVHQRLVPWLMTEACDLCVFSRAGLFNLGNTATWGQIILCWGVFCAL